MASSGLPSQSRDKFSLGMSGMEQEEYDSRDKKGFSGWIDRQQQRKLGDVVRSARGGSPA